MCRAAVAPRPPNVPSEADTQAPALSRGDRHRSGAPPYETRPRASRGDDVPLLGNDELARIFYEIGDMLEIRASCRSRSAPIAAAPNRSPHSPLDVARAYRDGKPPRAARRRQGDRREAGRAGRHGPAALLRAAAPGRAAVVVTLLQVPGLGPRTAGDLWRQAGIGSLDELEAAATRGRLRDLQAA